MVTPSRDESDFLPNLVDSMVNQSLKPTEWIIVSHNSSERTNQYLEEISEKHNWVSIIHVQDESKRRRGGQIASLVNKGLSSTTLQWDFFSKIDADMVLPVDYFERILSKFSISETLGIASGTCFLMLNGRKKIEKVSQGHTRGGLKTYRRDCFDQINGIRELDGWDGIDNIAAQMNGWEAISFNDLEVLHQRITGSHYGLVSGCFEAGKFAYSMGYFPPFLIARSLHRMLRKPLIIGGISMFMGYLSSVLFHRKREIDPEIVSFLRKKQKNRLKPW